MDKDNIMNILSGLNAFLKTSRGKDEGKSADSSFGGSSENSFKNGFSDSSQPNSSGDFNKSGTADNGGGLFGSFFGNGDKKSASADKKQSGTDAQKMGVVSAEYTKLPEQMSYSPELLNALSKYEAHMKSIGKKS